MQKVESKIVSNNQNYKHHPNDFVHGLFSSHAYIDSKENDIVKFTASERNDEQIKIRNEQLADWKVHKVFNEPEAGRYYAVTYINEKTKQMVLAHRGTTLEALDLLKTDSPFATDFKSILGGEIVAQQAMAYIATKEITEYTKQHGYNLSFTGHSLGAWLAELSLYFAHRDFNYSKAKAITFDSPGSAKIMDSFKPNILSHETDFDVRNLNITTYLSAPNFVNICNRHIHKAYRLFPEITAAEYSNKIINLLNKAVPIKNYITLLSLSGDLLDSMLDSFDPEIGKPIRYEKILDWPCIEYDPKDDTLGKKAIDRVLNFIPVGSTIKDLASKLIHRNITATTLGSFLEVIDQFVIGNITVRQFLEVYKHLENDPAQGYPSKKDIISAKDQFELSYKGHFRSQEVNLSTDIINTNNKGSSDWYLAQLRKLSIDKKEIPNLVKQQLKAIKEQYTIEDKNSKDYICTTSPNIKVDDLRGQILRLIEVSKEAKKILKDRNAYTSNEATKIIEGINSNLPLSLVHNFIAREEALARILHEI
ncbi:lipase family protein [Rickettsia endosymbiont of Polydrusus tereticollis]|uniref:lipase family protein n=1 Tax=Rickettsia endosymbiont of Polydrusus tereticollis TaxID=3066251 RepID=UPI003132AC56